MLKTGDKLYCKKEYEFIQAQLLRKFVVGEWYTISEYNESNDGTFVLVYVIIDNTRTIFKGGNTILGNPVWSEYFLTEQELRKQKIKKLNGI